MTDQACEHAASDSVPTVPPHIRAALSTLRLLDTVDNPAWLVPVDVHQEKPGRQLSAEEAALRKDAIACLSVYLRLCTPRIVQVTHPATVPGWSTTT